MNFIKEESDPICGQYSDRREEGCGWVQRELRGKSNKDRAASKDFIKHTKLKHHSHTHYVDNDSRHTSGNANFQRTMQELQTVLF